MADERTERLAREYLALCMPHARRTAEQAMGALDKNLLPLLRLLDWDALFAPCVGIVCEDLTADEIEQTIAYIKSPLHAKLQALSPKFQAAVSASLEALTKETP